MKKGSRFSATSFAAISWSFLSTAAGNGISVPRNIRQNSVRTEGHAMTLQPPHTQTRDILIRLSVSKSDFVGGSLSVTSPIDGSEIGVASEVNEAEAEAVIARTHQAYLQWRDVPAPRRGELVRLLGEELRNAKDDLGMLVTIECGKSLSEGLGEVQEMIDICDFAVGLSRQLYGRTIASERPGHRMMESWHPMGVTGIISAFNFPVAVWSWNAALALVCGNACVWKPSEKTPLTAIATQAIFDRAAMRFGDAPKGLSALLIGGADIGAALIANPLVAVISATGSTAMGRKVSAAASQRFARTILELGGNNAMIVTPAADRELALRGAAFSALGTAGQRCTTLRRLFVHSSLHDDFIARLEQIYASVSIGDPRVSGNLVGPLIDAQAAVQMAGALNQARAAGAIVIGGEHIDVIGDGVYVRPAIARMPQQTGPMLRETFAPILYVMPYDALPEAIMLQNAADQGLSSSIFTADIREAELFLSSAGSDCGIANVNIGTSGAEIGGAFGGEKETGGGRESGSDSWKAYMRRATNTINYSSELPLAQGVTFET
jgi:aldehyde dehydrogenase (NAD+)